MCVGSSLVLYTFDKLCFQEIRSTSNWYKTSGHIVGIPGAHTDVENLPCTMSIASSVRKSFGCVDSDCRHSFGVHQFPVWEGTRDYILDSVLKVEVFVAASRFHSCVFFVHCHCSLCSMLSLHMRDEEPAACHSMWDAVLLSRAFVFLETLHLSTEAEAEELSIIDFFLNSC